MRPAAGTFGLVSDGRSDGFWRDPPQIYPILTFLQRQAYEHCGKATQMFMVSNVLELLILMAGEERRWKNSLQKLHQEKFDVYLP